VTKRVGALSCTLAFLSVSSGAICWSWQANGDLQGYGGEASSKFQSIMPPRPQDGPMPGSAAIAMPDAITAARTAAGAPKKVTPGNKSAASATTTLQAAHLPTAKPKSKPSLAEPKDVTAPAQVAAKAKAVVLPVQQVELLTASAPQPEQTAPPPLPMPQPAQAPPAEVGQPAPMQALPSPQMAPKPAANQATVPDEAPILRPVPMQARSAPQIKPAADQATVPDEAPLLQPLPPLVQPAPPMAPKTDP
jgi:hypothetical protein